MAGRKEVLEGGGICIHITDSRCSPAETNKILESNHIPTENKITLGFYY